MIFSSVSTCLVVAVMSQAFQRPTIVDGKDAPVDKYDYMVQLRNLAHFSFCGGTIIAPEYVLTAGHCIATLPFLPDVVHEYENGKPATRLAVEWMKIHPKYHPSVKKYDLAILKLKQPIKIQKRVRLNAEDQNDQPGQQVSAMGWGKSLE